MLPGFPPEGPEKCRGELIFYQDQDESLWDEALIAKGVYYLNQASRGSRISRYHLEAAIAYWHTKKEDTPEKWENILQLFNHLLRIAYSPIAALNRAYVLSKVDSKAEAIIEAEKLNLTGNPYYYVLLGVLYRDSDVQKAACCLEKALRLAKTQADRQTIQKQLESLRVK